MGQEVKASVRERLPTHLIVAQGQPSSPYYEQISMAGSSVVREEAKTFYKLNDRLVKEMAHTLARKEHCRAVLPARLR